jgi:hypothetical protein
MTARSTEAVKMRSNERLGVFLFVCPCVLIVMITSYTSFMILTIILLLH